MRAKILLQRVAIDLGIVVGAVLSFGMSVASYFWIKETPERAKAKREAREFLAEITAETNSWNALKDVDFTPSTLSLAELEQKFVEKGWNLHWGALDGKIDSLLLLNEEVIQKMTQKETQS